MFAQKKTKAESKIRNQRLLNTGESRQYCRAAIQNFKMAKMAEEKTIPKAIK